MHDFILEKLRSTDSNTGNGIGQSQPSTRFNFSSHTGHVVVHYLYTGEIKYPGSIFAQLEAFIAEDVKRIEKDSLCALVLRIAFETSFCLSEFGALKNVVADAQANLSFMHANKATSVVLVSRLISSELDDTSSSQKSQVNDYIRQVVAGLLPAELRALAVLLVAQPADGASMVVDQMLLRAVLEEEIRGKEVGDKVAPASPESATKPGNAGTELGVLTKSTHQSGGKWMLPRHLRRD